MPDERRRQGRHPIQTPVNVCTDERRDRVGVTRDLSSTGMLFHSRSKFAMGERLELTFSVPHNGTLVRGLAAGRVVRESIEDNLDHMFRYLTAVQFEQPLRDLV